MHSTRCTVCTLQSVQRICAERRGLARRSCDGMARASPTGMSKQQENDSDDVPRRSTHWQTSRKPSDGKGCLHAHRPRAHTACACRTSMHWICAAEHACGTTDADDNNKTHARSSCSLSLSSGNVPRGACALARAACVRALWANAAFRYTTASRLGNT